MRLQKDYKLSATSASKGDTPGVFSRASSLLGWRSRWAGAWAGSGHECSDRIEDAGDRLVVRGELPLDAGFELV